jgi:hypothetical protein
MVLALHEGGEEDRTMRMLLLGARGAVGRVVRRELESRGHTVTSASRSEVDGARLDLRGDLRELPGLAAGHDAVINASGIERADLAAAVAWTAGLVGVDLHHPPEDVQVRNLREGVRVPGPGGRTRRYLRADFPDHVLLGRRVHTYLTLGSAPMTAALGMVGRMPALRGLLTSAPHLGTDAWHVIARNRRTGERLHAEGRGQSEATAGSRRSPRCGWSNRTGRMP